jgi:hypothetical protein
MEQTPQDESETEDLLDLYGSLLKGINMFRKYDLKKKPHVKEYYKLRKMHVEIVNTMVQYHEKGNFEQKENGTMPDLPVSKSNSPQTLYWTESSFDLDSELGIKGFYDLMIYKTLPHKSCITEDFLYKKRYRKPDKIALLESMLSSKLGLFEVTGTDFQEAYAYLKEVFTGIEYKIVDMGLSSHNHFLDNYLYTRIITCNGISFGTGLNFAFAKNDPFIKNHIKQHKKNYSPQGEFLRFSQLYNQYSRSSDFKIISNSW